jgi:lysyl-tRNA synthetase class 2
MHLSNLEKDRFDRLEKIRSLGFDPYDNPRKYVSNTIKQSVKKFLEQESLEPEETVQGRIFLFRDSGGLIFAQIRDHTATIQIAISKKNVSENHFKLAKLLEIGDVVNVSGKIRRTQTQEITIWVKDIYLCCKSLSHPPDKQEGIKDVEIAYRKPYLKMAFDNSLLKIIQTRSKIIHSIRDYFNSIDFIEVETPMLHSIAGGAAAKPFKTHLNSLDIPLYLRIAPELYLKKLIVGGLPKIFEINRNFRNEGIDSTHNPEFTVIEAYSINETDLSLSGIVADCLKNVVKDLGMDNEIEFDGKKITFYDRFDEYDYITLYKDTTGRNFFDEPDPVIANKIFEKECEKMLDPCIPSIVSGYPACLSPLTKTKPENPDIAQRSDLFIAGMEMGTFYTEQNDPLLQYNCFAKQITESEEDATHRTMDLDFIEALKVGMPSTGGFGLGIDRLVMLLTNNSSIRDVLAFPFMRPISTSIQPQD